MTEEDEEFERIKRRIELETQPLINFTKQKEWVGLTDEERDYFTYIDAKDKARFRKYFDYIEAKLKEKNHG